MHLTQRLWLSEIQLQKEWLLDKPQHTSGTVTFKIFIWISEYIVGLSVLIFFKKMYLVRDQKLKMKLCTDIEGEQMFQLHCDFQSWLYGFFMHS